MSKSGCERCRGRGFWDTDDQDTYFFKVMIGGFRRQMVSNSRLFLLPVGFLANMLVETCKLPISENKTKQKTL